jgi:hypothetical protein
MRAQNTRGGSVRQANAKGCRRKQAQPPPGRRLDDRWRERDAGLPRERLAHLARAVHQLGPRPLYELFVELNQGASFQDRVERYAALPADFIKQLGADRLPPVARVVSPTRKGSAP